MLTHLDLEVTIRMACEAESKRISEESRDDSNIELTYKPCNMRHAFESNLKPEPFEPIEPLFRRRPKPGRFRLDKNQQMVNEPLKDIWWR